MVRKETEFEKRLREARLRDDKIFQPKPEVPDTRQSIAPAPTPKTPKTSQAQAPGSVGARVSLADRQELADARARNAGLQPRLLEDVRTSGILSERRLQEEPLVQAEAEAERVGIAQEEIRGEQPQRRELDPFIGAGESVPVIGGGIGAVKQILSALSRGITKVLFKDATDETVLDDRITPEDLRTLALTEIEKREIQKGLTDSEQFGQFVEGIPLIGSFAAKYAGGLIETPSENTQTILKELKTEKTRATNVEIKVKDGTLSPASGDEIITSIEQNIQRMESRIKLLVQNSPELKFNSDGVNFIETKILESRERLFQAKINMAAGASKDPTEIDLLRSLQGSISLEDFTIPNR